MIRSFVVVTLLTVVAACTPKYQKFVGNYSFNNHDEPNYASLDYWAAHPNKHDPSDSIPEPLRKSYQYDSTVDVFFIHPTTFLNTGDTLWNASVDEAALNARTDYSTILFQASVFNEARLFAPRYRQANLKAYFTTDTARANLAFDLAYQDVRSAFQYYLEHYNNGHPIIIASHSQGSTHAIRLLREFFDNKPLQEKLIVAYVVGMNIPFDSFQQLRPCRDSLETGCFCGWRTFRRGHEPALASEFRESYVTNPLNWTTGNDFADASLNKGAVLRNFDKLYVHVTDAQIHDDILWSNRPKFPGSFLYRVSNYHIGDINLFYVNVRENVKQRIAAYKNESSH